MGRLEIEGLPVNCKSVQIEEILLSKEGVRYFPKIVTENETNDKLFAPYPLHGRSIVVDYNAELKRYIITKGNGLTYYPTHII